MCAQNLVSILHSIVHIAKMPYIYDHLTSTKIFTLIMNKIITHTSFEYCDENGYNLDVDLLTISY